MAIILPILLLLLPGYIVSSKIGTTKDTKLTNFSHTIMRGETRIGNLGLKHVYNDTCDTMHEFLRQ